MAAVLGAGVIIVTGSGQQQGDQRMMGTMGNLDSMMKNGGMMKDEALKNQAQRMQEHLQQMTQTMRNAMENMPSMMQRMSELQKK